MRHFPLARRAGLTAAVALAGVLTAGPALAGPVRSDVSVNPPTAAQTTGVNFTFHVTNSGTAPIVEITVGFPADTPVAEIFPLTGDPGWAPKITLRKLAAPLTATHGTPVTETASSITWIAMPGTQLAAGRSADVQVSLGPLPSVSAMKFPVTTKVAGGGAGPSMATQVTLTPATAEQQATGGHGGGHNGGATAGGAAAADQISPEEAEFFQQAIAEADRGPSVWAIGGWVVAGLALVAGAVMMLRNRHRAAEDDDEPDDDDATTATTEPVASTDAAEADAKEPVAAGSKWSFKG